MAQLVKSHSLFESHHRCGNSSGRGRVMGIDWTWISPTAEAPGKKVGTLSLKRWQRNLHNRHYSPQFVCRSVAAVRQALYSIPISSRLPDSPPKAMDSEI